MTDATSSQPVAPTTGPVREEPVQTSAPPSEPVAERVRLAQAAARHVPWYRWGPYLSDRQWGTVREDYSATGDAWEYLPFEHARSRAYRWGGDGIFGITARPH